MNTSSLAISFDFLDQLCQAPRPFKHLILLISVENSFVVNKLHPSILKIVIEMKVQLSMLATYLQVLIEFGYRFCTGCHAKLYSFTLPFSAQKILNSSQKIGVWLIGNYPPSHVVQFLLHLPVTGKQFSSFRVIDVLDISEFVRIGLIDEPNPHDIRKTLPNPALYELVQWATVLVVGCFGAQWHGTIERAVDVVEAFARESQTR